MSVSDWKLIPAADLVATIPVVSEWLKQVYEVSGKRLSYVDCLKEIIEHRMQLWTVNDPPVACVVTEIVSYPQAKFCRVFFAAGTGTDWARPVIEQLEEWSKPLGCEGIEIVGRKGWAKLLPEFEVSYMLSKEFSNG